MPVERTMRRWVIDRYGRDAIRIDEASVPSPGPGELLVKMSAVALNARAGVVEAVGDGGSRFRPGDRVIANFLPEWIDGRPGGSASDPSYRTLGGHFPGVLADYVCFPEGWFTRAPDTLDDAGASTLPVAGLTAWFALVEQGRLKAGDTVLIPGTGGVAVFALQLAAAHGAEVIVTSSSGEKLRRVLELGASHAIDRTVDDVVTEVLAITNGRGVDHVLDLVGGDNFARSVAAVAPGGRVSVIGLLEGVELRAPTVPVLLKAPVIQGIVTGHRRALEDLVRAVDRTGLKPVIDRRYTFGDLPAALDHLAAGPFGKLVIDVAAP